MCTAGYFLVVDYVTACNHAYAFFRWRVVFQTESVGEGTCAVYHIFCWDFVLFSCEGIFEDGACDFSVLIFDEIQEFSPIYGVGWYKSIRHFQAVSHSCCQHRSEKQSGIVEGPILVDNSRPEFGVQMRKYLFHFESIDEIRAIKSRTWANRVKFVDPVVHHRPQKIV